MKNLNNFPIYTHNTTQSGSKNLTPNTHTDTETNRVNIERIFFDAIPPPLYRLE